jgi:hypothetical protein
MTVPPGGEEAEVLDEHRVHELAMARWQAGDFDQAAGLLEQALYHFTLVFGANHPRTLAAKGDMAAVLFELGQVEEAGLLERDAFESARMHLGKAHAVTCVLAWNRARGYERSGDLDSAKRLFADELVWLLAEDPSVLEADQNIIRTMLAERFDWDSAKAC